MDYRESADTYHTALITSMDSSIALAAYSENHPGMTGSFISPTEKEGVFQLTAVYPDRDELVLIDTQGKEVEYCPFDET
jgi:hypothetical protein